MHPIDEFDFDQTFKAGNVGKLRSGKLTATTRSIRREVILSETAKDEQAVIALMAALTRAFDDGSPVAGQSLERRREIAVVALRRIRSFRRRGVSIDDCPDSVRDLAKGLADYLEAEPNSVGPLIKDYQLIASELLDAFQTSGRT